MFTVHFTKEKETKNTVRYAEQGDENVIGSLYIAKRIASQLGDVVTVTLVSTQP